MVSAATEGFEMNWLTNLHKDFEIAAAIEAHRLDKRRFFAALYGHRKSLDWVMDIAKTYLMGGEL